MKYCDAFKIFDTNMSPHEAATELYNTKYANILSNLSRLCNKKFKNEAKVQMSGNESTLSTTQRQQPQQSHGCQMSHLKF